MFTICNQIHILITAFSFLSVSGQQATVTYFVAKEHVNYSTAVRKCASMRGSLAAVSSQNIQEELQKKSQELPPGEYSKSTIFYYY